MPLNNLITAPADTTANVQTEIVEFVNKVSVMPVDDILRWVFTVCAEVVWKVLLAALIYFIGNWLIKRVVEVIHKVFVKRDIEISLSNFIISIVRISLNILLILTVVGVLGINTTSFLAIFASAGLAVGMALSGTLQNFAGGVLILFLKPFKIGDLIEAQGYTGTVKEISLFSTLLNTFDNKMVIIPNGGLSTNTINNFSKESTRRVEWIVGIAYGSDYTCVKEVVQEILDTHPLVLQNREKFVALHSLGDSSVNIVARVWCASEHYWALYFDINEQIYNRFNEEGIEFPFPQMDVHLRKE